MREKPRYSGRAKVLDARWKGDFFVRILDSEVVEVPIEPGSEAANEITAAMAPEKTHEEKGNKRKTPKPPHRGYTERINL